MQPAIGYLRVSTQEQGRSGLGLAAQRHEIEALGAREGFSVKSWYQDVQTGAGADAPLLRPGLVACHASIRPLAAQKWTFPRDRQLSVLRSHMSEQDALSLAD